jgi:hypothetical protein
MKTDTAIPLHSTKLLDRVKEAIRYKYYSASTEQVYVCWCHSYIRFDQLRHPKGMGTEKKNTLITHLLGVHLLLAKLLYGTGMRLNEAQFAIQRFRFSESDYYRERVRERRIAV